MDRVAPQAPSFLKPAQAAPWLAESITNQPTDTPHEQTPVQPQGFLSIESRERHQGSTLPFVAI